MIWAAVLLRLMPSLDPQAAERLVVLTEQYAEHYQLPVALLLAIQYRETRWGTRLDHVSAQDHGLMGLRVTRITRPEYLGREHELLDVATNIRLAAEALAGWRTFHRKRCPGGEHPWHAHYQWGRVVRDPAAGVRVERTYQWLMRWRFRVRKNM